MFDETTPLTRRETLRKGTAALAFGALGLTGTGAARQPRRARFDLAGVTLTNPCTDEDVEITDGRLQVQSRVRSTEDGGHVITVRGNTQGVRGVGTETGRRYVVNSTFGNEFATSPPYPVAETLRARFQVVSQGPADNYVTRVRLRVAVADDGTVAPVSFEPVAVCTG